MNTAKAAAALNTISLAFGELAEALNDSAESLPPSNAGTSVGAAPARATGTVPASEPSPFEDEAVTWEPPDTISMTVESGSLVNCPKHRSAYLPSKFKEGAFYCPADSDDPAWRNSKGKCRITPANAAEYLRIKAAA